MDAQDSARLAPNVDQVSFSFPPELERLIFETAALLHPDTIPKLLRVAKRVLQWIEPFLYHTIQIYIYSSDRMSGRQMLRRMETKGTQFFSAAVRDIEIISLELGVLRERSKNVWTADDLQRVLSVCTNVKNLLLVGDLDSKPILPALAHCRPSRLFLVCDLTRPSLDFRQPLFRNLTHLVLGELNRLLAPTDPGGPDLMHWPSIFRLPSLTHLAILHSPDPRPVHGILVDAPHLHALVISVESCEDQSVQTGENDERIVYLPLDTLQSNFPANGSWMRGVDDLWAQVDDFIDRRRRGEVEAGRPYLVLPSKVPGSGANIP